MGLKSRNRLARFLIAHALAFPAWLAGTPVLLNCQATVRPEAKTLSTATQQMGSLTCPGGFPTDLTVTNCDYTRHQRVQQWIDASFNDQAMLGAVVYGTGAQIIKSPGEWGRNWGGFGDRIGVRYTQGAARGTAEFIIGSLLRDDPRHLSYKDDPHTQYGDKVVSCEVGNFKVNSYPRNSPSTWTRIGHALRDSVTVLKSNPCGIGDRIPAVDRIVGIAAGAYGGYAWYPRAENSISNAGMRAAGSYGSTLVGSFYTEFSPEITLVLSKLFGKKSSAVQTTQ